MAGIGDELAHPLLGPAGGEFRLGPGIEGGLDLRKHRVERLRQPPDLGPRVEIRYPAGQVACGDGAGGLLDIG